MGSAISIRTPREAMISNGRHHNRSPLDDYTVHILDNGACDSKLHLRLVVVGEAYISEIKIFFSYFQTKKDVA